jgi:hypothetical protein
MKEGRARGNYVSAKELICHLGEREIALTIGIIWVVVCSLVLGTHTRVRMHCQQARKRGSETQHRVSAPDCLGTKGRGGGVIIPSSASSQCCL